jgi:4-diphosphocytidyl-2C-methyl-D-erythritol kinase
MRIRSEVRKEAIEESWMALRESATLAKVLTGSGPRVLHSFVMADGQLTMLRYHR